MSHPKKSIHHRTKSKSRRTSRTPIWPFAIIGLSSVWAGLVFFPRDIAVPGYIALLAIGAIVATVGAIRMAISPFQESASCGLMYTYVPRYWLYYLVTRRQRMLRPFLWHIGGDALAIASFVALTARMAIDPVHHHVNPPSAVAVEASVPTLVANGDGPGN
jgi:hypothetical protein